MTFFCNTLQILADGGRKSSPRSAAKQPSPADDALFRARLLNGTPHAPKLFSSHSTSRDRAKKTTTRPSKRGGTLFQPLHNRRPQAAPFAHGLFLPITSPLLQETRVCRAPHALDAETSLHAPSSHLASRGNDIMIGMRTNAMQNVSDVDLSTKLIFVFPSPPVRPNAFTRSKRVK